MKKTKPTPKQPETNKRDNTRFETHSEMLFVHKVWREKDKKKKASKK